LFEHLFVLVRGAGSERISAFVGRATCTGLTFDGGDSRAGGG
jgi:hypothetical protein